MPRHPRVVVRVRSVEQEDVRAAPLPLVGQFGNFSVDAVFEQVSQAEFYEQTVQGHVDHFMQGTSSVVLVYGATQSGKTYTVEGPQLHMNPSDDGIVPRACADIFAQLSNVPKHRYKVLATACGLSAGPDSSMVDLLSSGSTLATLKDTSSTSAWGKVARQQLARPEDIYKVLSVARQSAARSPRPLHICLALQLLGQVASGDQLSSTISFVELLSPDARDHMGRPCATDPALSRIISLGYSSLAAVLALLKQQGATGAGGRATHVPWRDSALTRWLQHPLTQAEKLLVLGTVSPTPQAAPDTLATLSYVSKLRPSGSREGVVVTASWERAARTSMSPPRPSRDLPLSGPPSASARAPAMFSLQAATPNSPNVSRNTHSTLPFSLGHNETPSFSTFTFEPTPTSGTNHQLPTTSNQPIHLNAWDATTTPQHIHHRRQGSPTPAPRSHGQSPHGGHTLPGGHTSSHGGQASHGLRSLPPRATRPASPPPVGTRTTTLDSVDLPVPPSLSPPSKSTQQDLLSAYLGVLKALKLSQAGRQAEAQLEVLYTAVTARGAQDHALLTSTAVPGSTSGTAVLERVIVGLQQQLDGARAQMARYEDERGAFTHEIQRLGEMSISATQELEWQAREASLERDFAVLRDKLASRQAALDTATMQVADSRREAMEAQAGRERAEMQLQGAVDKLQAQVQSLTDETSRLKRRATEAAAQCDQEGATRRTLEAQLAQMQAQAEGRQAYAGVVQQQLASLHSQLQEANQLLDTARAERSKMQEGKWQCDEALQRLTGELEAARTARQQGELEARAAAEASAAQARQAADSAAALQANLNTAEAHAEELKSQVTQLQQTVEDQKRLESTAARDITDVEAMLREFERDLEVHASLLWREMRAERSDVVLLAPDRASLTLAARWRPVLRTLLSSLRKQASEQDQMQHALGQLRSQLQAAASKAVYVDELSASLRAHQSARMQAQAEVSELSAQLHDCEAALAATRSQLDHLGSSHQHLSGELSATHAALAQLQAEHQGVAHTAGQAPALLHKVQVRDHVLSLVWVELTNMQSSLAAVKHTLAQPQPPVVAAGDSGSSGGSQWDLPAGVAASSLPLDGLQQQSPQPRNLLPLLQEPSEDDLDLSDPVTQQRVINAASQARVQVSGLVAHLAQCQHSLGNQGATLTRIKAERNDLKLRVEEAEDCTAEVKQRLSALQSSYALLDGSLQQLEVDKTKAETQVCELTAALRSAEQAHRSAEGQLVETREELAATIQRRDAAKAQADALETQLVSVRGELAGVTLGATADGAARQKAELEATMQAGRVAQLEGQVADLKQQVASTTARLSATEKALMDATSRVSDLTSKVALAETDARIKVQELGSKLAAAEGGKQVAVAQQAEVQERLSRELRQAEGRVAALQGQLETAQADRRKAVEQSDALDKQLRELQVRLQDASHVHSQLHTVMADRDALQDNVRQLRNTQATAAAAASQEVSSLHHELETVRGQLQQVASDRLSLVAQVEVAKLGSVVSSALARSKAATTTITTHSPGSAGMPPSSPHVPATDGSRYQYQPFSSPLPAAEVARYQSAYTTTPLGHGFKAPAPTSTAAIGTALGGAGGYLDPRSPLYTLGARAAATPLAGQSGYSTPAAAWKVPVPPYGGATTPLTGGIGHLM